MSDDNRHLVGRRAQIPAWVDRWMRGDRYGEIVATWPHNRVSVKMDKTGDRLLYNLNELTLNEF